MCRPRALCYLVPPAVLLSQALAWLAQGGDPKPEADKEVLLCMDEVTLFDAGDSEP
jgi:hypothetical protein